jgi:MFS family permease
MTGATPLFRQSRGVKFVDGKVFPAFTILNGSEGPGAAPIVRAVAMTLAVQALTSMALAVPAVLAPVAAGDFGEAPTAVGRWVGFSYMAAMFAGLASGTLVGRHGPVRVLQAAVLGVALGLAVGALTHVASLLVCGALLGAAHGLVNPASSAILAAAAPARVRSMIFSIKQTGVPVGGAVAGILVPVMLLWTSWQYAVLALALSAAALIAVLVPFRRVYDSDRGLGERLHLRRFAAPVAEVWADRRILGGVAAALFTAGWPLAAVVAVCALYGASAVGWNGVFLAEVARLAPEGRVAVVTGGTQFFTFAGVLIGPPVFGAIAAATGSYSAGFVLIAALPLAAGIGLLVSGGRSSVGGRP